MQREGLHQANFFMDDKGKGCVNQVEVQDETQDNAIANFKQSLCNEVNRQCNGGKTNVRRISTKKYETDEGDDKRQKIEEISTEAGRVS